MDMLSLTAALKQQALALGFDLAGVCPAETPRRLPQFESWLEAGYAGDMAWLPNRQAAYRHPRHVLDGVRSIVLLATNYHSSEPVATRPGQGRVSRYAWGDDYHDALRGRLHSLADWLRQASPGAVTRCVVDTAPLFERELAQLAGLGWVGKNTLLLNKQLGSWFFLAALLTDVDLACDAPHELDHCGTCRACLDACPTGAFVEPYVLDSRRCISYLTIELRGAVPEELRPGLGDWLLGCDVCQEVCPWNHRAPVSAAAEFQPAEGMDPVDLAALFDLDDAAFRRRFRHTPLWRPKRRGILRNAAILLGNRPVQAALPALVKGLHDVEPLVRAACAWALSRYDGDEAADALRQRLAAEEDPEVRREILAGCQSAVG